MSDWRKITTKVQENDRRIRKTSFKAREENFSSVFLKQYLPLRQNSYQSAHKRVAECHKTDFEALEEMVPLVSSLQYVWLKQINHQSAQKIDQIL